MWIVFHSRVERLVCISTGMWGVCVPQLCGAACVHFHRHVGSVCSTVVWRGLCAFPQACGECVPQLCGEFVCISTGMWQCVSQLCGGFVCVFL